jgi:hypothetical protein
MLSETTWKDSAGKIERSGVAKDALFTCGGVFQGRVSFSSRLHPELHSSNGDVVGSKRSQMHDLFFGGLRTRQFARYPAMTHDEDPVGQG